MLLEQATGQTTGSIYNDRVFPRGPDGLVIKTHALDAHAYDRAVHLVRNPFDVIESFFHWTRDVAGRAVTPWTIHVHRVATEWRDHSSHWLDAALPTHRVRYEDLHARTGESLTAVLAALDCNVPQAAVSAAVHAASLDNMRAMAGDLGPAFFRRGEVGASTEVFSADEVQFVIETAGDLMQLFGFAAPLS